MKSMWKECLDCKVKCCNSEVIELPLFLTKPDLNLIKARGYDISKLINATKCYFYSDNKKCNIHSIKPVDCKLFPFDIDVDKITNEPYWIIWELDCVLAKKLNDLKDAEPYLKHFEKTIIPYFKEHIQEYSDFNETDLVRNHEFKILRKIKID
ncbi:YkgJ family cysteine cluster protein [Candidatus Woesearchaeota archaeon]|nr:YkgJ family cysteine cluster protein [Candidatus Woesearchaeota archaeon]